MNAKDFLTLTVPEMLASDSELAKKQLGTFELTVQQVGVWTLDMNGNARIHETESPDADCRISGSDETFSTLISEPARVFDLVRSDDLKVSGTLCALNLLRSFLPSGLSSDGPTQWQQYADIKSGQGWLQIQGVLGRNRPIVVGYQVCKEPVPTSVTYSIGNGSPRPLPVGNTPMTVPNNSSVTINYDSGSCPEFFVSWGDAGN